MSRAHVRKFLVWGLRWIMAGTFVFAAYGKILDPGAFAVDVANYQMVGDPWIRITAVFLPWLELWCAVALLAIPPFRRSAWWLFLAMLAGFTWAKAAAITSGLEISCGCFGGDTQLGWMDLGVNALLLGVCVLGLWLDHRWIQPPRTVSALVVA